MKDIIDKAVRGELILHGTKITSFKVIEYEVEFIYFNDGEIIYTWEGLKFSHDFLKAYFGEDKWPCEVCQSISEVTGCPEFCLGDMIAWQYHAQQLVLADDREEYLRRYL